MEATIQQRAAIFFLYGYRGIGKTYIWKTLASALRAKKKIVLTVTSSGIASLLLPGGRTTYSKFRIPIPTLDNSICNVHQGTDLATLLKMTSLIIWDVAPMAYKFCFQAFDRILRNIIRFPDQSNVVFRGKVFVFG